MFEQGINFDDLWRNAAIGQPDEGPRTKERYWSTGEIMQVLVALSTAKQAVPWWAFAARLVMRGWIHAIGAAVCAFSGSEMLDYIVNQHGQKGSASGGLTG